ncbi:MAG: hypothetical protein E6Q33_10415 [Neisseriales bacterium]|jgi:hypothetical protein|nr:MAG: hypothetical protein E6Q33_10415 [Neisseriales bacterium]
MRKILPVVIGLSLANISYGQEMPSVFNKSLAGDDNQLKKIESLANGELIVIGGGASKSYFARLNADGKIIFEKKNDKDAAISYNDMVVMSNGSALVVGGGNKAEGAGRISLFDNKGVLVFDKVFGKNSGGYFTKVKQDHAGNFIAVGIDGSSPSRSRITKIGLKGDIIFDKIFREGTVFNDLIIEDDDSFIGIGGDAGDSRGNGLLIKLSSNGDKVYEINSGKGGCSYTSGFLMDDGSLLVIGGGRYGTGNQCRATRVRVDGQVIFDKTYSTVDSWFSAMAIDNQGQIILSAEEFDRGRILKLRPDGTIVFNKETASPIVDLKVNAVNQVIAVGSKENAYELFKLSPEGKVIFDIPSSSVALKKIMMAEDGKIYAIADRFCRILKFDDANGDLLFDKDYGKIGSDASFASITNLPSGEVVAIGGGKGDGSRITKISHGASINDITVMEPIGGTNIAKITVSLTGFLLENGVRKPVTISYKSLFNNKVDNNDITPIDGVLSFIPSDYAQGQSIEKTIELPVHSDQLFEGTEKVSIEISDAKNTHISKAIGVVTIEDAEASIRFVSGSDAVEGKFLGYTVGLFKSDGTALINKTGSPIKISYRFGPGSAAPGVDFDANTTKKQLVINDGESTGSISIKTIEDSFYRDPQSVQLVLYDLNYAKNSVVGFWGNAKILSATQYINDIGAEVQISKISDHSITGESASMFKVSLVKASDGSNVTNCSGGNIRVKFVVDSASTAVLGKNFFIGEDVFIMGNCSDREADVKVVFNPYSKITTNGSIILNIVSVSGPPSSGPLNISSKKKATALLLAGNK